MMIPNFFRILFQMAEAPVNRLPGDDHRHAAILYVPSVNELDSLLTEEEAPIASKNQWMNMW